jgi:hypothetical protein
MDRTLLPRNSSESCVIACEIGGSGQNPSAPNQNCADRPAFIARLGGLGFSQTEIVFVSHLLDKQSFSSYVGVSYLLTIAQ